MSGFVYVWRQWAIFPDLLTITRSSKATFYSLIYDAVSRTIPLNSFRLPIAFALGKLSAFRVVKSLSQWT